MLPEVVREWRTFYRGIWNSYGVTPEEYRAIYLAQLGRCYGCQEKRGKHPDDPKGGGARRLAVDHNHALGYRKQAVRGLLCSTGDLSCNRIIGGLKDRPEALERLAHHLRTAPAQSVLAALAKGWPDDDIVGMVLHP
jgi:hypothetical protein